MPNVRAEALTYKVALKSASEVPPNASSGSGTADVTYDTQSKKLSWKVSYSGLTGPATAAHFHGPAEPGKNAGVMVPIQNIATSPAEGSATLTDAQAADLMAGRLLCQRSYGRQSGRRDSWSSYEVTAKHAKKTRRT